MENIKTYKVTKGNIVTGADGEKVIWEDGADNTVELTADQAKPLKDAGVIA
jgi:hypothetical protein